MKKKVVTTLLSAMLCVSMVPAAPVMASFDDDATGVEVSAEDFGDITEEDTEEATDENADAEISDADVSDVDIAEEDTEDTADVTVEEDIEDVGEATDADDEIALFSDDAQGQTVTLNGVEFDTSKTYIVPLTLKNAADKTHEQDSAAVACPGKFGTLTFDADGTPKLQTNLRSVTVGTLTDYAYNFKIYQGNKIGGDAVDATVVNTQEVPKANGEGNHVVPETISFAIPKATFNTSGVYLSMYVDAMGYAPDAYLLIDYAGAKVSGDPEINYTKSSTAEVEQFGNYNVVSEVTVTDGRITDVVLKGEDFKGSHADDNEMYFGKAANGTSSIKGMKDRLIGLYMTDAQKLNDLDTVTGATYSSNAIKTATMNALGVKIEQEIIPDAPEETPAPGLYTIDIKDRTAVVDHGLVGESKKATAYLRVDDAGKMWLTYKMVSGTTGEPLYVLGYNGYYVNNDSTKLTTEGVTYSTEMMEAPTIGENPVVTDITVPLDSVRQTYVNNVSLYVEAMKNLDGEVSGVWFDKGKFDIDSTITLYWDTLNKFANIDNPVAKLSDGVYKVQGEMYKVNKVDYSMSNNAINHNIKLTVKNGVPYISMNFNGMNVSGLRGYLKNLNYYKTGFELDQWNNPIGDLAPVTIDSYQRFSDGSMFKDSLDTDYPNDVTFPMVLEAIEDGDDCNYIPLQVFVPVMDSITAGSGTQNVYLKLDYSTITKTTADDKAFAETEAPIVKEKAQTISGTSTFNKKYGDKAFSLGAKAKTAMTYKSSNTKVAVVSSKGVVTIKGVGTAKITINAKAGSGYKAATKTVTVKVAKAAPTIKVKTTSATLKAAQLKKKALVVTPGASVNSKGTLTYQKISGSKQITINAKTGKLSVKKGTKKGTYKVTIRVKAAAKGYYNAGTKNVTVTIRVK